MKKPLITLTVIALTFTPLSEFRLPNSEFPPLLAQTTPGFNPDAPPPPGSSPPPTDDWTALLEAQMEIFNQFYEDILGGLGGTLGDLWGLFFDGSGPSWFGDLESLTDLMVKLVSFPTQIGGWWDGLLATVTDTLDPCLWQANYPGTPPFIYEAGWCTGGGSDGGGSSPSLADDFELLGHTNPDLAPPSPRQSVGEMVKAAGGPAGLPVPSLLRYESDRAVDTAGGDGDRFEVNPTVISHYTGNTLERGAARLQSEAVLGALGQAKLQEELTGIQEAVTGSFATAEAAQGLSVTQDVMKQMAQLQAGSSLLLGSLAAGNQQLRVDNAFTHLNLSNISRSLDEANRSRRIDRTLHAYKVLRSVSQSTLF